MITLNISDELYTQITKTLNDTRNAKNSMTHELESQQLDLNTAISELKHPSAVVELMKASDNAQANIELLNAVLRAVKVENVVSQTISINECDTINPAWPTLNPEKMELSTGGELTYVGEGAVSVAKSNGQVFSLKSGDSICCDGDDDGSFGLFRMWSKDIRTGDE